MKYDIEKEEQQFMNFINDQYNVYKEIDNIYTDFMFEKMKDKMLNDESN